MLSNIDVLQLMIFLEPVHNSNAQCNYIFVDLRGRLWHIIGILVWKWTSAGRKRAFWDENAQLIHSISAMCSQVFRLKSVFSEIRVRTWIEVVSRQKNRPLIGRPDKRETTWTHVLTRISEKTDFSVALYFYVLQWLVYIFWKVFWKS